MIPLVMWNHKVYAKAKPKKKKTKTAVRYFLSDASRAELHGVHRDLIKVVQGAICVTELDFSVLEGIRSVERQKELFNKKKTKTMKSRHLTGHAVDLVPYVKGKSSFDWNDVYKVARAMRTASIETGIPIKWGGVWDKNMDELDSDMKLEVMSFISREECKNPDRFLDGVHFQLCRKKYLV